jgi:hypothetical protein
VSSIPGLILDTLRDGTTSSIAIIGTVRPHLEPELIKNLVRNDALREWMKEDPVQRHICGIVRMNIAGRSYLRSDSNNKAKGVRVLESVNDTVDCRFLHLRENPCVCDRPTTDVVASENVL